MVKKEIVKVEEVPAIPELPSAIVEQLRFGDTLVRAAGTDLQRIALQRPRNEVQVRIRALANLGTYRSAAEEAEYSKPVGDGKMVSGLSIRAAEDLGNLWGNNAWRTGVIAEDADGAVIIAEYVDGENGLYRSATRRVSRRYKSRDGNIVVTTEDRFDSIVIPAAQSKLLREVILRALPFGLKEDYRNAARERLAETKEPQAVKNARALKAFAEFKVDQGALENLVNRPMSEWDNDLIATLRGIYNSIKQGEQTIEEVFRPKAETAPQPVDAEKIKTMFGDVAGTMKEEKKG